METVRKWSGREIRALRGASRLSVRAFAAKLGVDDRLVSKWEAGGTNVFPRPDNQSMLDQALGMAGPEVRSRFAAILAESDAELEVELPRRAATALCELVPDITDFTAREEAERLVEQLANRTGTGVRIISVYGKAGVGKTTLAVHVAHRVREYFPDGQLYVNLRGTQAQRLESSEVLGRFLQEFGLRGDDIPADVEDRARLFRARLSDRRVLVVLDNAGDEQQVRHLLPGSPGCAVLVTSRKALLGLAGAQHVSLGVMTLAQGLQLLDAIIDDERVPAAMVAAEEIVRLCGCLPLALRIAGARLVARRPDSSLAAFAELLRDEQERLNVLQAGDIDVRASFGLSYDSCPPEVRRAFRLLGMLEAIDFPAWVLAVLADVSVAKANVLLEDLVDAELIETAGEAAGKARYRFHDLLRLFAKERLRDEEMPEARLAAAARLVDAYLALCIHAASDIAPTDSVTSPPPLPDALSTVKADPDEWVRVERSGLIAAVTLAYVSGLWHQTWRLAEYVDTLLRWQSGLRDEVGEAMVRRQLADNFRYTGRLQEGVAKFKEALAVFEKNDSARMMAGTLNGLGDIYRTLGRRNEAIDCLSRAIDIYEKLGDVQDRARMQMQLATVWRDKCLYDKAEKLYEEGLRTLRQVGDREWEVRTLRHLGILNRNMGRIDDGLAYLGQTLEGFEQLAHHRGVAVTTRNIGDAHRYRQDFDEAEFYLRDALTRFQQLGDVRWESRTRTSLADLDGARGRWGPAVEQLDEALGVFSRIGDDPGRARALWSYGILYRRQGKYDPSLGAFADARGIYIQLGDQVWAARALAGSADTFKARGDDSWPETRRLAEEECIRAGAGQEHVASWLLEW